jgi:hypothetical protein
MRTVYITDLFYSFFWGWGQKWYSHNSNPPLVNWYVNSYMRLEVLSAMPVKVTVFWDILVIVIVIVIYWRWMQQVSFKYVVVPFCQTTWCHIHEYGNQSQLCLRLFIFALILVLWVVSHSLSWFVCKFKWDRMTLYFYFNSTFQNEEQCPISCRWS